MKAKSGSPKDKLNIMTPSCLSVDRAMIFFISISDIAIIPAMSMVTVAVRSKHLLNIGDLAKVGEKRISKNTPAVTRVDECTNAETGVGAAIAAGSQAENGIWALFVIAATMIVSQIRDLGASMFIDIIFQESILKARAIEISSRTSPNRFVNAVMSPALHDLGFL